LRGGWGSCSVLDCCSTEQNAQVRDRCLLGRPCRWRLSHTILAPELSKSMRKTEPWRAEHCKSSIVTLSTSNSDPDSHKSWVNNSYHHHHIAMDIAWQEKGYFFFLLICAQIDRFVAATIKQTT
jgi:hypothetical protein